MQVLKWRFVTFLTRHTDTIDDNRTYRNKQLIACTRCATGIVYCHGLCAFLQYMGDTELDAKTIKSKMDELIAYGCEGCGSVPIYPGNNVKDGELTVNYVAESCCERVCPDDWLDKDAVA